MRGAPGYILPLVGYTIAEGRMMPATCVKSNRRYFFPLRNEEGVVLRMWAELQSVFI